MIQFTTPNGRSGLYMEKLMAVKNIQTTYLCTCSSKSLSQLLFKWFWFSNVYINVLKIRMRLYKHTQHRNARWVGVWGRDPHGQDSVGGSHCSSLCWRRLLNLFVPQTMCLCHGCCSLALTGWGIKVLTCFLWYFGNRCCTNVPEKDAFGFLAVSCALVS